MRPRTMTRVKKNFSQMGTTAKSQLPKRELIAPVLVKAAAASPMDGMRSVPDSVMTNALSKNVIT